jgi:hypothetical protein
VTVAIHSSVLNFWLTDEICSSIVGPPFIMLTFGLTFALALCTYGLYRLATKFPQYRGGWRGVWRLAGLIAALRISALWFGLTGLRSSDWLQSAGYLVLMLDLPEIYLVRSARSDPFRWAVLGSVILASTSIGWAAVFCWVCNRLRLKPEADVGHPEQH